MAHDPLEYADRRDALRSRCDAALVVRALTLNVSLRNHWTGMPLSRVQLAAACARAVRARRAGEVPYWSDLAHVTIS
jgi:hypothetical protein